MSSQKLYMASRGNSIHIAVPSDPVIYFNKYAFYIGRVRSRDSAVRGREGVLHRVRRDRYSADLDLPLGHRGAPHDTRHASPGLHAE